MPKRHYHPKRNLGRVASLAPSKAKLLTSVCFHEAGHAVIAHLLGIHFDYIIADCEVVQDDKECRHRGLLGFVSMRHSDRGRVNPWLDDSAPMTNWNRNVRNYLSRGMCVYLAGYLAETIHTGCWKQPPNIKGEDEDYAKRQASWHICSISERRAQQWVNRMRFTTLQLLMQPAVWAAVTALAQSLIERRKLTAGRAVPIIQAAMPFTIPASKPLSLRHLVPVRGNRHNTLPLYSR